MKLPSVNRRVPAFILGGMLLLAAWPAWTACAGRTIPAQATPQAAAPEPPSTIIAPARATPIIKLDDVRIGMKGYGLTVFHGATIEPFAVEVISVMRDFAPQKGVIWIRCPDERMQKTGPVAGMSGSPIYLWDDGQEHELGQGGKLAGAFAYGYQATKDCYVGVQPIELMREVGVRAEADLNGQAEPKNEKRGTKNEERSSEFEVRNQNQIQNPKSEIRNSGGPPGITLQTLLGMARQDGLPAADTWRLAVIAQALGVKEIDRDAAVSAWPPPPTGLTGQVRPLMLPMPVGSAQSASLLAPLLGPMGILPTQTPRGAIAGQPPREINARTITIQPGSVLTIPLVYGDLDLSAAGTVTDVLPDGRVLAFGHPMFGEGDVSVPMASGFVHYIVPGLIDSFKLAGSGVIQGAIVRDEGAGIAGSARGQFEASSATVVVNMPRMPRREYHYQLAQYRPILPIAAAIATIQSLSADASPPAENTVRIRGTLTFAGDRQLKFDALMAGLSDRGLFYLLLPPISAMQENEHQSVLLTSMSIQLDVEPTYRITSVVSGRLEHVQVAPGGTVAIDLRLQPYNQELTHKRITFKVPDHLPDGTYPLVVADARSYQQLLGSSRPHRLVTNNVDDVHAVLKEVMGVRTDALYVLMPLPEQGLAIGREELPQLPSSRKAILAAPTSAPTTTYGTWEQKTVAMDSVMSGQLTFSVEVKKDLAKGGR
ncbi:MAG: hypothetical protein WD042_03490 [Phycisphaeraceae bacterium]